MISAPGAVFRPRIKYEVTLTRTHFVIASAAWQSRCNGDHRYANGIATSLLLLAMTGCAKWVRVSGVTFFRRNDEVTRLGSRDG